MHKLYYSLIVLLLLSSYLGAQEIVSATLFHSNNSDKSAGAISTAFRSFKKNELGEYFALLYTADCDTVYLGDKKFTCEDFDFEADFIDPTDGYFLVKLTPELAVDTFLRIKGIRDTPDFEVTDNFVFIRYNFWYNTEHSSVFGDTTFYHNHLDRSGIIRFDSNLNFIDRPIVSSKQINQIALNDSLLVYQLYFGTDTINNGHFEVIKGDTLHTKTSYHSSLDVIEYHKNNPFIITYDIINDTIKDYWTFEEFYSPTLEIEDMDIDQSGNILMTAYALFIESDTSKFNFIIDYDTRGNLQQIFTPDVWLNDLLITQDGGYLVDSQYAAASYPFRGDTLYNYADRMETRGNERDFIIKYNEEGNYEWHSYIPGYIKNTKLKGYHEDDHGIYTYWYVENGDYELNGINYNSPVSYPILKHDKKTGEIISHLIDTYPDNWNNINVQYVEGFPDQDRIRIFADLTREGKLFGLMSDFRSSVSSIFLDAKMSFLSAVKDETIIDHEIRIYPNPIVGAGTMQISSKEVDLESYEIYSLMGQLVDFGKLSKQSVYTITVPNIPSGAYVLNLESTQNQYSQIFIKH